MKHELKDYIQLKVIPKIDRTLEDIEKCNKFWIDQLYKFNELDYIIKFTKNRKIAEELHDFKNELTRTCANDVNFKDICNGRINSLRSKLPKTLNFGVFNSTSVLQNLERVWWAESVHNMIELYGYFIMCYEDSNDAMDKDLQSMYYYRHYAMGN